MSDIDWSLTPAERAAEMIRRGMDRTPKQAEAEMDARYGKSQAELYREERER